MKIILNDAIVIWIFVSIFFLYAAWKTRNDIADVAWGLGFAVLAWASAWFTDDFYPRQVVLGILVTLWAVRLSGFVFWRNHDKGEDARYAEMRKGWGKHPVLQSYFKVFWLQGLILLALSVPLILTMSSARHDLGAMELGGGIIWAVGFFFEAVSDQQKYNFKKIPGNQKRMIQSGLWSLSRHPNYFGETLMWWGIYIYALGDFSLYYTAFSPALLTFLLLKVSGVPLLEKSYAGRPEFEEYRKLVPQLIPIIGWK